MMLKLQAHHLWYTVKQDDAEFHNEGTALDVICSVVPPEMVPTLANKESAKDALEAIGEDRVWKATAQNLHAEYKVITLHDG
jgi:hypothetical protein